MPLSSFRLLLQLSIVLRPLLVSAGSLRCTYYYDPKWLQTTTDCTKAATCGPNGSTNFLNNDLGALLHASPTVGGCPDDCFIQESDAWCRRVDLSISDDSRVAFTGWVAADPSVKDYKICTISCMGTIGTCTC